MDNQTLLIVGAAVLAVLILVGLVLLLRKRSRERRRQDELQERYGPEYERTVAATGSRKKAAADLADRERRREDLDLHALDEHDLGIVRERLAALQYRFLDDPEDALLGLSRVVREVLRARGYPISDEREEGLRLFAVDHPRHVQSIRDLLEGHHDDAGAARRVFLNAREALRESVGVEYDLSDAAGRSETVAREVDVAPAGSSHDATRERRPDSDSETEVVDVVDEGAPAHLPSGANADGGPAEDAHVVDLTDDPSSSSAMSPRSAGDGSHTPR